MSDLTDAQTAYLTSELGTPGDGDVANWQARYDRLGDAQHVAVEVIRQRIADLVSQPATIRLPDGLSIGTGPNITALQAQLTRILSSSEPGDDGSVVEGVLTQAEMVGRRVR